MPHGCDNPLVVIGKGSQVAGPAPCRSDELPRSKEPFLQAFHVLVDRGPIDAGCNCRGGRALKVLSSQAAALLDNLVSGLKELASVIGPLSDAQIGAFGPDDRQRFMRPVNAGSFFGLSIDNIVSLSER